MTAIQWTNETWNPIVGCTLVSPGCTNCYALKQAARLLDRPNSVAPWYIGVTKRVNGSAVWSGKLGCAAPHKFEEPLKWRKPRRVFVNSMGDLFHEDAPRQWIDDAFGVMERCPQHQFQVLTKRHERMRDYMRDRDPLPNVWLGVSVEDQRRAEGRAPVLLETPAAIRFASVKPLLEPVDLRRWLHGLDWVIVGGESGEFRVSRPFDLAWARDVLAQCREGVACFVKQMGSVPVDACAPLVLRDEKGGDMAEWPEDLRVREWPP